METFANTLTPLEKAKPHSNSLYDFSEGRHIKYT